MQHRGRHVERDAARHAARIAQQLRALRARVPAPRPASGAALMPHREAPVPQRRSPPAPAVNRCRMRPGSRQISRSSPRRTMMQPPRVTGCAERCQPPTRPSLAARHGIGPPADGGEQPAEHGRPRSAGSSSPQARRVEADEAQRVRSGEPGEPGREPLVLAAPRHGMRELALRPWHARARTPGSARSRPRANRCGRDCPDRSSQGWPAAAQGREQPRLGHRQQRPQQPQARQARAPPPCRRGRRRRCRPRDAAPPSRPGRRGDAPAAGAGSPSVAARVREQRHARGARRRLDAGRGLGARPDAGCGRRCRARCSQAAAWSASAADSGRSPWSTISAQDRAAARARAQSAASSASAMLSGPPDTATARRGSRLERTQRVEQRRELGRSQRCCGLSRSRRRSSHG